MAMNNKVIRQGDVLLKPVDKTIGTKEELTEYTVAHGEQTGHHHTLYPLVDGAKINLFTDKDRRFIELSDSWALRHQEHHEITIEPGTYEIGMEREYDPFERMMKKVID